MRKAIGPKPSPGLVGGKKTKRLLRKKSLKSNKNKKKTRKHKSKNRRRHRRYGGSKHGSTVLPQPLVNLGRDMMFNGQSFINSFVGSPAPVNPDPTVQPIIV